VRPAHKTLLLCAITSASAVVTTLLVWQLLTPADRTVAEVPFGEFLTEVRVGHVDTVHVDGNVYRFTVRSGGPTVEKHALGPPPDIGQVRLLRPSDPLRRPPTVYFER
jgi:hypothetical protein